MERIIMESIKGIYPEDDIEVFEIVKAMFPEPERQLIRLPRNEESLSQIESLHPNVILVEHRFSDYKHYNLLSMMDDMESLSQVPKIAITDPTQKYELLYSPKNRLWDYIAHPFEAQELLERIHYGLEKVKFQSSIYQDSDKKRKSP